MSWTDIAIAPLGPVYFGDGRPRDAGETDYGAGRFPPSPLTTQGILRTALLRGVPGLDLSPGAAPERIAALVGPPERLPEGWQIAGPWLACWREDDGGSDAVAPWLALPRYVVGASGDTGDTKERLTAIDARRLADGGMRWDVELDAAPLAHHAARFERAYLDPDALPGLLAGRLPEAGSVARDLPPFVAEETRVGLQVESEREVAAEGMLYTLGYRRLADHAGFVLRFQGELAEALDVGAAIRGVSAIGGKSRLARLLPVRGWSAAFEAALGDAHLPKEPSEDASFWLWTTTPVALERPWRPQLSVSRVEVVTAVVGRLEAIGGFGLAGGRSRAAVGCVPAGSAWLIRLHGGDGVERGARLRALHDAFPFEGDPGLRAMGFGHTLVACLPKRWS